MLVIKVCTRCQSAMDITMFHINRTKPDGRQSECKECKKMLNAKSNKAAQGRRKAKDHPPLVYFIHQEGTDWWKIGLTTNLEARLGELRTGNPHSLVVKHTEPGGYNVEAFWHNVFARRRGRGEWFWMGDDEHLDIIIER